MRAAVHGRGHDVVVRQQVAVGADDEAGSAALVGSDGHDAGRHGARDPGHAVGGPQGELPGCLREHHHLRLRGRAITQGGSGVAADEPGDEPRRHGEGEGAPGAVALARRGRGRDQRGRGRHDRRSRPGGPPGLRQRISRRRRCGRRGRSGRRRGRRERGGGRRGRTPRRRHGGGLQRADRCRRVSGRGGPAPTRTCPDGASSDGACSERTGSDVTGSVAAGSEGAGLVSTNSRAAGSVGDGSRARGFVGSSDHAASTRSCPGYPWSLMAFLLEAGPQGGPGGACQVLLCTIGATRGAPGFRSTRGPGAGGCDAHPRARPPARAARALTAEVRSRVRRRDRRQRETRSRRPRDRPRQTHPGLPGLRPRP